MAGRKKKSRSETHHDQNVKDIFSKQLKKACQIKFFNGNDKEITYKELFKIHKYLDPEDAALCLNDADKNDAVRKMRQWLSGEAIPEHYTLIRLCDKECLNCSLDFLFGRIECTKHDIQFIHDETGLSEGAIKKLMFINKELKSYDTGKIMLFILSRLIENGDFSINLMSDINNCFDKLMNYTIKKQVIEELHKESGGDIIKEIQLRQTKKYKNTNNNLKDLEDLKDLNIYHTQNHFLRILNDFLSKRVKEVSKDD